MTPKEFADNLIESFLEQGGINEEQAVRCAIVCVKIMDLGLETDEINNHKFNAEVFKELYKM